MSQDYQKVEYLPDVDDTQDVQDLAQNVNTLATTFAQLYELLTHQGEQVDHIVIEVGKTKKNMKRAQCDLIEVKHKQENGCCCVSAKDILNMCICPLVIIVIVGLVLVVVSIYHPEIFFPMKQQL
jgi:t-SNARE complex subunit (syntaxin)